MIVLWLKALVLWTVVLALAIVNGAIREMVLVSVLGRTAALVLSGITLSAGVALVAWFGAPWYGKVRKSWWLKVGVLWLAMTLLFEFGLARCVMHKTWTELFDAYTFRGGNLWPLVLVITFGAPWAMAQLRGMR